MNPKTLAATSYELVRDMGAALPRRPADDLFGRGHLETSDLLGLTHVAQHLAEASSSHVLERDDRVARQVALLELADSYLGRVLDRGRSPLWFGARLGERLEELLEAIRRVSQGLKDEVRS